MILSHSTIHTPFFRLPFIPFIPSSCVFVCYFKNNKSPGKERKGEKREISTNHVDEGMMKGARRCDDVDDKVLDVKQIARYTANVATCVSVLTLYDLHLRHTMKRSTKSRLRIRHVFFTRRVWELK